MDKLLIKENKKLVLKNVLIYEIKGIKVEQIDKQIQLFVEKIKTLKVKTFGPLISKNYGISLQSDGEMITDYDIMVQASDYLQYKGIFKTASELSISNCVYLHFEDNPQYINFAYSKLDVYFYEKDLISSGVIYNVLIKDSPELMIMDIFKPVKTL